MDWSQKYHAKQKAIHCMIPFIWHSEKGKVYEEKQISGCEGLGEKGLTNKKIS